MSRLGAALTAALLVTVGAPARAACPAGLLVLARPTAEVLARLPLDPEARFALGFRHSVTGREVVERYRIEEGRIVQESIRFDQPGPGLADPLPPGAVLAREPGGFVVRLERPIDQLWLRVAPEAHNRLMAGRDLALAELGHGVLEIRPAPCPE